MKANYLKGSLVALTAVTLSAVPFYSAHAANTADTTINASVNSTISLTSTGAVTLAAVMPTGATPMASTGLDTLTVNTNSATGYKLSLNMATGSNANNLVNGSNTLAATAAGSTLTTNSWGYSIDAAAKQDNVLLTGLTAGSWKPVPVNGGTADQLKTTAAPATNDTTSVRYGMNANSSQASGTYTGTVTYTAVTN